MNELEKKKAENLREKIDLLIKESGLRGFVGILYSNQITYSYIGMGAGQTIDHLKMVRDSLAKEISK